MASYMAVSQLQGRQVWQIADVIFDGTRGFFLAANGFDGNAVDKFSGDAPRIVLMTGEDLAIILDGTLLLVDVMKAKVDAIVRHGNIDFRARDIK